MTISFSGLASGMDTSSWVEALVSAKEQSLITPLQTQYKTLSAQKTTLDKVKATYSTLLTSTQAFTDAKFGVSKDIFSSNIVSSSDEKKIVASVTNSTPRQTISVEVLKLATATKVTSQNPIAAMIDENTNISSIASGNVKEGVLSFYVGGKRYSVDVEAADTLGAVADKMESAAVGEDGSSLIDVSFEDGKFTIVSTNGEEVRVGTNSDTSNLASALSLSTKDDGAVQSLYSIGALDLNVPLLSVESGFYKYNDAGEKVPLITEGTFTIGGAEFTINEKTTMNELISKINTSSTAEATAFYDSVQNKLVLTSKQEGAFNVNIEGGTSNITDILGLTSDGNIIPETQDLGHNAEVVINGSTVQSYSNTLTSEVSGISGLTLDLKDVTETGKAVSIVVGQDTDKIIKQFEDLINSLNSLISTTDSATASGGDLQYDSSLNSMRSSIRVTAASAIQDAGTYKTLASIGITTGKVGASVDAETNQFTIDKEMLKEALSTDPESVRLLLIGDESSGITGLVQQIQDITDNALDVSSGFFKTRSNTLDSQIENVNTKITNKTAYIESYQEQLEKKFQAMETQISNLQSQYSQMSSIIGS